MSLRLPLLPEGPSPSVLAPVWVDGRIACFHVVGNSQTNLHVPVLMPGEQTKEESRILMACQGSLGRGASRTGRRHFIRNLLR
jgi:hypothetical protein